jgi:hypothetical protein
MSDIYKKKARKYKYKYLKLKQEYIGGAGGVIENDTDEVLQGGAGCVTIIPISLQGLEITQQYPYKTINLEQFSNNKYVGKFMSCADDIYGQEYENLKLITNNKWDRKHKYTQKLCFAGYVNYQSLITHLETNQKFNLVACIKHKYDKYQGLSFNTITNNNICYLITTKVGTSFEILLNKRPNIINNNIVLILTSLKNGISNFINKLYRENFVLGDINTKNMTYDETQKKVYFIDYGIMHNSTIYNKIKHTYYSYNVNYSLIISMFYYAINELPNTLISKQEFIKLMKIKNVSIHLLHKYIQDKINYLRSLISNFDDIYNNYIDTYFSTLPNYINLETEIDKIYRDYILPIAKNTDIYALCLFIYNIVNIYNKQFVKQLLIDVIENKINGPIDLSIRLDKIIKQIQQQPPPAPQLLSPMVDTTSQSLPPTIIAQSSNPQILVYALETIQPQEATLIQLQRARNAALAARAAQVGETIYYTPQELEALNATKASIARAA